MGSIFDFIARRSGRSQAFFWPSLLRIGPEASRFRGESEGNEAATGISSPKRYLWSSDPVVQPWKFRATAHGHEGSVPVVERSIYRFVNDRGDVLEQLEDDKRKFKLKIMENELQTASKFSFSKSSFFTFMLAEVIAQAMSMMNNPGVRRQRRLTDTPRRLRRIIMTIPSATPVQEQRILKSRAEAAVKLVWSLAGWGEDQRSINGHRPEVHCSWDEASSVHLVYLYGEAVHKLGGSIKTLFDMLGKDRARPTNLPAAKANKGQPERSLRIASVDVGGGTTDLMVTTYYQTDNIAIYPDQNFREGFRIAGDDLLKTIIERLVIPRLEEGLLKAGLLSARNFLKDRFAGDNPTMTEQEKHLRRQFVLQVLQPIAIGILGECEEMQLNARQTAIMKVSEFFDRRDTPEGAEIPVDDRIVGYLKQKAGDLGATTFKIADFDILIDPVVVDDCVLATFDSVSQNGISEHLHISYGRRSRAAADAEAAASKPGKPALPGRPKLPGAKPEPTMAANVSSLSVSSRAIARETYLAKAAVGHWTENLLALLRNDEALNTMAIDAETAGELVSELIAGARRSDLESRIAIDLERLAGNAIERPDILLEKAGFFATSHINRFASTLGFDTVPEDKRPRAPDGTDDGMVTVFAKRPNNTNCDGLARVRSNFAYLSLSEWMYAFHQMVIDNVMSGEGCTGASRRRCL
nr:virulence factor SrfB [Rhizobium ruizarguesonis]